MTSDLRTMTNAPTNNPFAYSQRKSPQKQSSAKGPMHLSQRQVPTQAFSTPFSKNGVNDENYTEYNP